MVPTTIVGSISQGWKKNGKDAYDVLDETPRVKLLKQEGSVREYYDAFVPFSRKEGWNDSCAMGVFVWGLQPEIERSVKLFKPKTLREAYSLAILKEVTIERLKVENKPPFAPTFNLNNSYVVVDEFCKENVNVEEIECIDLTALDECCEEKV